MRRSPFPRGDPRRDLPADRTHTLFVGEIDAETEAALRDLLGAEGVFASPASRVRRAATWPSSAGASSRHNAGEDQRDRPLYVRQPSIRGFVRATFRLAAFGRARAWSSEALLRYLQRDGRDISDRHRGHDPRTTSRRSGGRARVLPGPVAGERVPPRAHAEQERALTRRPDGGAIAIAYGGMWLMVDEAHITTFAVHPDHRRRRIGERLLVRVFEMASALNAEWLTLEVRASNLGAQKLYEKYGFRRAGVRRRYYSDNNEDALIMWTERLVRSPCASGSLASRQSCGRPFEDSSRSSFVRRPLAIVGMGGEFVRTLSLRARPSGTGGIVPGSRSASTCSRSSHQRKALATRSAALRDRPGRLRSPRPVGFFSSGQLRARTRARGGLRSSVNPSRGTCRERPVRDRGLPPEPDSPGGCRQCRTERPGAHRIAPRLVALTHDRRRGGLSVLQGGALLPLGFPSAR